MMNETKVAGKAEWNDQVQLGYDGPKVSLHMCIGMSICMPIHMFIHMSMHIPMHIFMHMSMHMSMHISRWRASGLRSKSSRIRGGQPARPSERNMGLTSCRVKEVSCMCGHACCMYVACVLIDTAHVACMLHARLHVLMYVACMLHVCCSCIVHMCRRYACMMHVCCMCVARVLHVCCMCVACMLHKCCMHGACLGGGDRHSPASTGAF